MTTDTIIRTHIEAKLEAVPDQEGDMSAVMRRGRREQRRRRLRYSIVGVAAAFLAVVPVVFLTAESSPSIGGYTDTEVTFESGFTVPVDGPPIETRGALVFTGVVAVPEFDASVLGINYPLTKQGAGALVVPSGSGPTQANALNADTLVLLGAADGAQLALQQSQGFMCVFFGNGTDITGGGYCGIAVTAEPTIGYSTDPAFPRSDGGWLVWTQLPEAAAVVTVELPDGTTYWQHVVARTAFFAVADLDTLMSATATAYDAQGNEILVSPTVLLQGHDYFLSK